MRTLRLVCNWDKMLETSVISLLAGTAATKEAATKMAATAKSLENMIKVEFERELKLFGLEVCWTAEDLTVKQGSFYIRTCGTSELTTLDSK